MWNDDAESVCTALSVCGYQISALRDRVRTLLSIQHLLVEAHDILGCATAILEPNEVDLFQDMSDLEKAYQIKSLTWTAVSEAVQIGGRIMTSKLGTYMFIKSFLLFKNKSDIKSLLMNKVNMKFFSIILC